ncbi:MAG: PIN domain-containing protein [Terriglobales bacterium]
MRTHVLDANALYRFLTDGPDADIVQQVLEDSRRRQRPVLMSVINWGEVYHAMARSVGYRKAELIMRSAEIPPIILVDVDKTQAEAAARLRAGYGLPYADCFAAVLASKQGVVVTADVKDFRKVPWIKTLDLPPHKHR